MADELKELDVTSNLKETIKKEPAILTLSTMPKQNVYEEFFNSANAYFVIIDSKTGFIIDANKALLNLLEYSKEELLKKTASSVFKNALKLGSSTNTLLAKNVPVELKVSSFVINGAEVLLVVAYEKRLEAENKSLLSLKASNLALLKTIERLKEYEKKIKRKKKLR